MGRSRTRAWVKQGLCARVSNRFVSVFGLVICGGCLLVAGQAFAQSRLQAGPLLEEAIAARRDGNFAQAEGLLVRANDLAPENADILLLLGLTWANLDKLDQAIGVLEQARALAPGYADIRLALSRFYARKGDLQAAIVEADAAIAADPNYGEVRLVRAGLALRQSDPGTAARHYRRAAELSPEDHRALLGQGDAAWRQENWSQAKDYYVKAAQIAPDNPTVTARLQRKAPVVRKWRVDLDHAQSNLSRNLPSWQETIIQISHRRENGTRLFGRVEHSDRSFAKDTLVEVGFDTQLTARLSFYTGIAVTPDADFRQKWSVRAGATLKLREGAARLGPTLTHLDAKVSEYAVGKVAAFNVGLEQYFLSGRFWVTATSINVRDENGNFQHGLIGRLNASFADRGLVFAGYAQAPETEEGRTRDTKAYFAGLSVPLTDTIDARVNFTRDERENSYSRNTFGVGFAVRF